MVNLLPSPLGRRVGDEGYIEGEKLFDFEIK
jgi:hypothetical protein